MLPSSSQCPVPIRAAPQPSPIGVLVDQRGEPILKYLGLTRQPLQVRRDVVHIRRQIEGSEDCGNFLDCGLSDARTAGLGTQQGLLKHLTIFRVPLPGECFGVRQGLAARGKLQLLNLVVVIPIGFQACVVQLLRIHNVVIGELLPCLLYVGEFLGVTLCEERISASFSFAAAHAPTSACCCRSNISSVEIFISSARPLDRSTLALYSPSNC